MTGLLDLEGLQTAFRDQVVVEPDGIDRFAVGVPLLLDDGDYPTIVVKRDGDRWVLGDEGTTYLRLGYEFDDEQLASPTRRRLIDQTCQRFGLEERRGELLLTAAPGREGLALYDYATALVQIESLKLLSEDRVRSAFADDARSLLERVIPADKRAAGWFDAVHDPGGHYRVDYRIEGRDRELMTFLIATDDRMQKAHITILTLEKWGRDFDVLTIFEDLDRLNRKDFARYTDVAGKAFTSLAENVLDIERYLKREAA